MYIPSETLFKLIQSEQYGVWAEKFDAGQQVALIIKASSSTLKAVIQGCIVNLYIGLIEKDGSKHYLAIGVKIFDSEDSPLLIPMVARFEFEHKGIIELLEKQSFILSLYDEMDLVVCSAAGCIVRTSTQLPPFDSLAKVNLCNVESMILENNVIDSFCYEIDPSYGTTKNLIVKCIQQEFRLKT